jgi:hypothetical protein
MAPCLLLIMLLIENLGNEFQHIFFGLLQLNCSIIEILGCFLYNVFGSL